MEYFATLESQNCSIDGVFCGREEGMDVFKGSELTKCSVGLLVRCNDSIVISRGLGRNNFSKAYCDSLTTREKCQVLATVTVTVHY